jgi:formylglycine-generating enzyme required for sulfatase activity
VRGGHWQVGFPGAVTATVRNNTVATLGVSTLGFRCARTDPP